jgi:hypothetical protein
MPLVQHAGVEAVLPNMTRPGALEVEPADAAAMRAAGRLRQTRPGPGNRVMKCASTPFRVPFSPPTDASAPLSV